MDGVIVDSMEYHAESWKKTFSDYGIEISKLELFKREGMSGLSSILDVVGEKGVEIPDKHEQKRLLEKKLQIFESYEIHAFPLVSEILNHLSSRNIKLGLVTGSIKRSVNHVLPHEINHLFNVIVSVDDVVNGKPHPEPYLKAIDMLKCDPECTLVIENAPLGIESAKKAGLDCFAIETTLPDSYLKNADRIFKSHRLLFEYFNEM